MSAYADIAAGLRDAVRIAEAAPVLDQTTVRALCDAGYVTSGDYVALAAANGWQADSYLLPDAGSVAAPSGRDTDHSRPGAA